MSTPGQSVGYLLPMGPWYAFADLAGLPTWLAERLWLGAIIALSVWGAVKLVDELYGRSAGSGPSHRRDALRLQPLRRDLHQPDVGRPSGLRGPALAHDRGASGHPFPRGWLWPAAIGLMLAFSGGGTNATFVVLAVLAPVALLAYDAWVVGLVRDGGLPSGWRAALCALVGSAWWVIPLALAAPYGADFLSFTEQPASIWTTASMAEGCACSATGPSTSASGSTSTTR